MRRPSHTAIGTWSGGRYLHFGEPISEERLEALLRPGDGLDTLLTADAYGSGEADVLLGRALAGVDRGDYCVVGAIGHDFYTAERDGAKGFPRFTDPSLRGPEAYGEYVRMATERSLERLGIDAFDVLLLHNPDRTGYTSEAVWDAMRAVRDEGLAHSLGVAPGPGERLHARRHRLPRALRRAHRLGDGDPQPARAVARRAVPRGGGATTTSRSSRASSTTAACSGTTCAPATSSRPATTACTGPKGWVEAGIEKLERLRPIAERHGLTPMQLAAQWCLAHEPVACVVPTLIQEPGGRPIEDKRAELLATPAEVAARRRRGRARSARSATTPAAWRSRAPGPTTRATRAPTAGG